MSLDKIERINFVIDQYLEMLLIGLKFITHKIVRLFEIITFVGGWDEFKSNRLNF